MKGNGKDMKRIEKTRTDRHGGKSIDERKGNDNKQELTSKSWKTLFYSPLSIPFLVSCGVPSCIIDLRLGFNTFLVAGLVRNIFLDLGNLST